MPNTNLVNHQLDHHAPTLTPKTSKFPNQHDPLDILALAGLTFSGTQIPSMGALYHANQTVRKAGAGKEESYIKDFCNKYSRFIRKITLPPLRFKLRASTTAKIPIAHSGAGVSLTEYKIIINSPAGYQEKFLLHELGHLLASKNPHSWNHFYLKHWRFFSNPSPMLIGNLFSTPLRNLFFDPLAEAEASRKAISMKYQIDGPIKAFKLGIGLFPLYLSYLSYPLATSLVSYAIYLKFISIFSHQLLSS